MGCSSGRVASSQLPVGTGSWLPGLPRATCHLLLPRSQKSLTTSSCEPGTTGNWQLGTGNWQLADLRHLDPFAVLLGAGDGRLDEGHAGDAVGDAGVVERLGGLLAATAADGPFQRPVQVGQGFVEAFGVAG